MDHQTRAFLAMAMSENVEGRFALLDLFTEEGREYERLHHDFKLLDEVFADFFETNRHRGRCWTLEEILGIKTSHPGKEFGYSSSHVPYFSTVWCYEGRDSDVITLKLHNDGFAYVSYPGMRTTRHHSIKGDQPGWVEMPMEDIKKQIPAIMARVTPLYTSARVWYNFALQKLDLLFTAPENANMPELTIGFEKGRPAYQHQMRAHNLRL